MLWSWKQFWNQWSLMTPLSLTQAMTQSLLFSSMLDNASKVSSWFYIRTAGCLTLFEVDTTVIEPHCHWFGCAWRGSLLLKHISTCVDQAVTKVHYEIKISVFIHFFNLVKLYKTAKTSPWEATQYHDWIRCFALCSTSWRSNGSLPWMHTVHNYKSL